MKRKYNQILSLVLIMALVIMGTLPALAAPGKADDKGTAATLDGIRPTIAPTEESVNDYELGKSTKFSEGQPIWVLQRFPDVPEDYWFHDELQKYRKLGVVVGEETGVTNMRRIVTAAEVYTFFVRYIYSDSYAGHEVTNSAGTGILGDYVYHGRFAWLDAYNVVNTALADTVKALDSSIVLPNGQKATITRNEAFTLYGIAALSRVKDPNWYLGQFSDKKLGYYARSNKPIHTYDTNVDVTKYFTDETIISDAQNMSPLQIRCANLLMYLGVLEGKEYKSIDPDGIVTRCEAVKLLAVVDKVDADSRSHFYPGGSNNTSDWGSTTTVIKEKDERYTITWKSGYSDDIDYGWAYLEDKAAIPEYPGKAPERTGYTFRGWSEPVTDDAKKAVTVTALWDKCWKVTWFSNYDNNLPYDTVNTTSATDIPVYAWDVPVRTGYTFKGWGEASIDEANMTVSIPALWEEVVVIPGGETEKPNDESRPNKDILAENFGDYLLVTVPEILGEESGEVKDVDNWQHSFKIWLTLDDDPDFANAVDITDLLSIINPNNLTHHGYGYNHNYDSVTITDENGVERKGAQMKVSILTDEEILNKVPVEQAEEKLALAAAARAVMKYGSASYTLPDTGLVVPDPTNTANDDLLSAAKEAQEAGPTIPDTDSEVSYDTSVAPADNSLAPAENSLVATENSFAVANASLSTVYTNGMSTQASPRKFRLAIQSVRTDGANQAVSPAVNLETNPCYTVTIKSQQFGWAKPTRVRLYRLNTQTGKYNTTPCLDQTIWQNGLSQEKYDAAVDEWYEENRELFESGGNLTKATKFRKHLSAKCDSPNDYLWWGSDTIYLLDLDIKSSELPNYTFKMEITRDGYVPFIQEGVTFPADQFDENLCMWWHEPKYPNTYHLYDGLMDNRAGYMTSGWGNIGEEALASPWSTENSVLLIPGDIDGDKTIREPDVFFLYLFNVGWFDGEIDKRAELGRDYNYCRDKNSSDWEASIFNPESQWSKAHPTGMFYPTENLMHIFFPVLESLVIGNPTLDIRDPWNRKEESYIGGTSGALNGKHYDIYLHQYINDDGSNLPECDPGYVYDMKRYCTYKIDEIPEGYVYSERDHTLMER